MKAIMTQSLIDSAPFNMFQILLFFGILVNANAQTVWTYNNQNGWPNDKCKSGSKQSPIEINPQKTDFEMAVMEPFTFENYNQMPKSSRLTNTGQLIEANFIFDDDFPVMIRDGGLKEVYKLDRILFHWGSSYGAEHLVGASNVEQNAKKMEIQLIHVKNDSKATNYTEAIMESSGAQDTLAILSVLVELKKSDNTKLSKLFDAVDNVKAKDQNQTFSGVKLTDILPRNTDSFYRYEGSMAFPNCTESVIWTIFKDPIFISQAQLKKFTDVTSVNNNYRLTQPLGTRKIKDVETSTKKFSPSGAPASWGHMLPLTILLPILKSL